MLISACVSYVCAAHLGFVVSPADEEGGAHLYLSLVGQADDGEDRSLLTVGGQHGDLLVDGEVSRAAHGLAGRFGQAASAELVGQAQVGDLGAEDRGIRLLLVAADLDGVGALYDPSRLADPRPSPAGLLERCGDAAAR